MNYGERNACATCKWWDVPSYLQSQTRADRSASLRPYAYDCRRHGPVITPNNDRYGQWPQTTGDKWCGEYTDMDEGV